MVMSSILLQGVCSGNCWITYFLLFYSRLADPLTTDLRNMNTLAKVCMHSRPGLLVYWGNWLSLNSALYS